MKLTTKNLLIILVVLALGFALAQLTKRGGRSKLLKTELVKIDTAKVSKIEILSSEADVLLTASPEGWTVSLADGSQKVAKQSAITGLLSSLNSIEPGRLVAKTQDKWKDYAVDSAGTRVKIYEGEEISTDIVIGRFGMEGQQSFYTFVRLFEDKEVYVAPNFMGMSIGKDAASYRENTLLRLKKDSLTAISFNYPDSSFQLSKDESWYVENQPADSASVASYLSGLGFVSSREFYDESDRSTPTHSVSFSFSDQPEIIIDGFLVGNEMIINSSENPNELFKDDAATKKVFKGLDAFLQTSE
ncbi:MAG: DUF4340 domain-containing protein [Bacteroidota bacterium]